MIRKTIKFLCLNGGSDCHTGQRYCSYQGRRHYYGQIVTLQKNGKDTCEECVCNWKWSAKRPNATEACSVRSCPVNDEALNKGCVPIYYSPCCPQQYYCREFISF